VSSSIHASCLQSTEDYVEVLLARLDALRRRGDQTELRTAFRAAVELLQACHVTPSLLLLSLVYLCAMLKVQHVTLLQGCYPDYVDRSLRLTSYWADCELLVADDIKAARAVWEDALKTPAGR